MAQEQEGQLPKPIMNVGTVEKEVPQKDELKELFGIKLPQVISKYIEILNGEGTNVQRAELAKLSSDELQRQLAELALLDSVLREFAQDPAGFLIRTSGISQDEQSYRVRLLPPSSGPLGSSPETAQTQLSLYARIKNTGETKDQIISATSIRGLAPEHALSETEKQFYGGEIMINTLGVFRSRTGSYLVVPRGGIELIKEGEFIDLNGLKPVGQHFHRLPVDNLDEQDLDIVTLPNYRLLHSTITRMSGAKRG